MILFYENYQFLPDYGFTGCRAKAATAKGSTDTFRLQERSQHARAYDFKGD